RHTRFSRDWSSDVALPIYPLFGDLFHQLGVLARIGDVDARGDDRERGRGSGQSALVRRGVDATRQAGDHQKAGFGQLARETVGEHAAVGAGVARADHGDRRPLQQPGIATYDQEWRRVGDLGEALGIARLAPGEERAAESGDGLELGLGLVTPAAPPAVLAAGLARETRQLLERPARAAEAGEQLEEGPRPHAAGAAELQPVDLLRARQFPAHGAQKMAETLKRVNLRASAPAHAESGERRRSRRDSVPWARRRMLPACLSTMISASTRYSSAACGWPMNQ